MEKAQHALQAVFAKKHPEHSPQLAPKQLLKYLEQQLGHRDDWDSPTLRALWPELAAGMTRKTRSIDHESSWLYLAGFVLRPGYGVQLDDSRMEELWRLFSLGMAFPKEPRVQSHWYLLWRRVAGGLNHPRQLQLLDKLLLPLLRAGGDPPPEIIYLAGALERLAPPRKIELIQLFSQALAKQRLRHKAPYLWALGRLLNRTPLYAGIDSIVHPREVGILFNRLKDHDWRSEAWHGITTLFALAARCTDQRDIDIDPQLREQIAEKMRAAKAPGAQIHAIETFVAINDTDREIQFGEKLPAGLILVSQN